MTTERLLPDPCSPHATATTEHRHIFSTFTFFPAPEPGRLSVTACEHLAVVPDEPLTGIDPAAAQVPPGLCPLCLAVVRGDDSQDYGRPQECRTCGCTTHHNAMCAVCRIEAHDEWAAQNAAATNGGGKPVVPTAQVPSGDGSAI